MKLFAAISTAISASLVAAAAWAADCKDVNFDGLSFTVCEANPSTDEVRLFLDGDDGTRLGTFSNVEEAVGSGKTLAFAMNAGMYHPDRSPVGLYIEDGAQIRGIVTREGPGNFGLLPNGVLCLEPNRAQVIESRAFAADPPECTFATQSGPMLVINGNLHPRFLVDSDSRYRRNGVGITQDGLLLAAISNEPVTFHEFGRLFRDALNTSNALFLDGNISRLHAPNLNRSDFGFPLGPILGVVVPAR